jgi:hypothetical protein
MTVAAVLFASAQAIAPGRTGAAPADAPDTVIEDADQGVWSYSASLLGYFVPESRDFAQPTVAADHGRLHLVARYNYEALNTGSAWLGCAFSTGQRLKMSFTPMLGGVFGDLNGVAPGYELTLDRGKFELYSEGEYVFDFEKDSGDFLYNWSELSITPAEWWRAGLVMQRTRVYETGRDFLGGLLAGASYHQVDLTTYVFSTGSKKPAVVISAAVSF